MSLAGSQWNEAWMGPKSVFDFKKILFLLPLLSLFDSEELCGFVF
jgi:hypothetical protein